MGHDYLDIADGHLRLNDFHIKVLGHLFAHCASTATADEFGTDEVTLSDLQSFFDNWHCLGPGVFTGTNFNSFATSAERFTVLHRLFEFTLEYIETFGDEIPLEYLDCHVNTPSMHFTTAQPTETYRTAVLSLQELIPA